MTRMRQSNKENKIFAVTYDKNEELTHRDTIEQRPLSSLYTTNLTSFRFQIYKKKI